MDMLSNIQKHQETFLARCSAASTTDSPALTRLQALLTDANVKIATQENLINDLNSRLAELRDHNNSLIHQLVNFIHDPTLPNATALPTGDTVPFVPKPHSFD
jgi:signal recognition particle GTPase